MQEVRGAARQAEEALEGAMEAADGWLDPNSAAFGEQFPVDTFFDNYLATLRNEGMVQMQMQGQNLPRYAGAGVPPVNPRYANDGNPFSDFVNPSTSTEQDGRNTTPNGSTDAAEEEEKLVAGQKTRKTTKQHEQNKKAQKRYRERQKQRTAELERSVTQLTARVKLLESVQEEKIVLQDKNRELEHALQLRNSEIEELQKFMDKRMSTHITCAPANDSEKPKHRVINFAHMKTVAALSSHDIAEAEWTPENIGALHKLWLDHLDRMRSAVEVAEREHKAISARDIPSSLVDDLRELVSDSISLCIAVHRCEGPNVRSLVSGCISRFRSMGLQDNNNHWEKVASALYLPPEKLLQILDARKKFLLKLEDTFEKRRILNCNALTMQASDLQISSAGAASGGCLNRAATRAELSGVLDELKENLRQEQRTLSEFTVSMLGGILDPFQAAVLISNAHPFHMDVVAVSNVFAQHANKILEDNLKSSRIGLEMQKRIEALAEPSGPTVA